MKATRWDPKRNELLPATRGVGFELVALKIANGDVLDVVEHPNKAQYPHQRMFILEFSGYPHLVPFVEIEDEIFLKTIIPSRQAAKRCLGGAEK